MNIFYFPIKLLKSGFCGKCQIAMVLHLIYIDAFNTENNENRQMKPYKDNKFYF